MDFKFYVYIYIYGTYLLTGMIQFDINKLLIAQAIHVRKSSNPIAKSLKQKINSIKVNTFNTLHSTKSTNPTSFSIKKKKSMNNTHIP